ncbi:MAG TPA: MGMT family protein [Chromatiaceae bacterium]|nr:MGMT family protein [Chromatiaceae bacterium]
MQITDFERKVYAACSKIRKGRVSTYVEIARAIGNPNASRAVGNALNKNPFRKVPCHRVVCSDGRIGGFAHGPKRKRIILEKEGVGTEKGRIRDFGRAFQPLR